MDKLRKNILNEQKEESNKFNVMISKLFHSRNQVHVFHLQTKSFAEHKALNDYYDDVVDIIDGLVESYQGKYDILTSYESYKILNYESNDQLLKYFKELESNIEENRKSNKDSYLQNQIDNAVELINSTIYKLKFLK
jgi:hypothetical protein